MYMTCELLASMEDDDGDFHCKLLWDFPYLSNITEFCTEILYFKKNKIKLLLLPKYFLKYSVMPATETPAFESY